MTVYAITPTGGRPEAFSQCQKYMHRQTKQPDVWIVIDDVGDIPKHDLATMIRPPIKWRVGDRSTQYRNILLALDHFEPTDEDRLIFAEDDDWYHPEYIERQMERLEEHDLVGEIPSRYYHVKHRAYRIFEDTPHASLCATAARGTVLPLLRQILTAEQWIDTTLWRLWRGSKHLYRANYVLGMKGMPGRPGMSDVHRREPSPDYIRDDSGATLRNWIGLEDAQFYLNLFAESEIADQLGVHVSESQYESFIGLGGQIRYRCPHCPLDHYSEEFITGHIGVEHKETLLVPPPMLYDADDRPITRGIYVPK